MADLLVRDVPDEVVTAVDSDARMLGLSRNEYVRRMLARETTRGGPVTADDLVRFGETFADLADPEVMRQAWR